MNYNIAKMRAIEFCNERQENIRIAKANKKEAYCILFNGTEPSKNYHVIETVEWKKR